MGSELSDLSGLQGAGAGHSEAGEEPQLPPRLRDQEEDRGGVRVAESELPVLLPPERDRGHAVDDDDHRSDNEKYLRCMNS